MIIDSNRELSTFTWDEIMETVEKVEKTESSYQGGFNVIIVGDSCTIQGKNRNKSKAYSTTYAVNNNKKKAVYESVLRFQQWLFDNIKKD